MHSTVLASLATLSLGATSLLLPGIAAADDSTTLETDPTAVMGPAQEYQSGLTVNGVAPTLRSVVVDGESILAYCIEYWIRAADPDHQAAITAWDEFTGDNNFKTDPQVRQHVAWILRNSYPTLPVAEVGDQVDAEELSTAEVITATQAAIWHFTDDFVPDGKLVIKAGPETSLQKHSAANVQAVFDYLTGSANIGLTEQEVQASVTLEDASEEEAELPEAIAEVVPNEEDHVFGPIRLSASTSEVDLAVHPSHGDISQDDLTVLDHQGQPVDLEQAVGADELWVHVPAETESGALEISAESIEYGYTGRLIIPEPDGQRRFQTIVVVDQATDHAATEIAFAWEQPVIEPPEPVEEPAEPDEPVEEQPEPEPTPEAEPTPQPSETPPAEDPVSDDPPVDEAHSQPTAPDQTPPPPAQDSISEPPTPVESVAADEAVEAELAHTGAHQTRNVLVALGTIGVGAGLLVANRLRNRRT